MKAGFCLPSEGPMARPEPLARLAQRAEEAGFYAVSFSDHIVIPERIEAPYPYTADHKVGFPADCMEQLTTLSFLAAKTSRVKLMTSIMVVPHRNPVLAAKMLANLDILSAGRLIVGAGAGWLREEFGALGTPPFEERGSVAKEYIRAYRELWGSEVSTFRGKYVSFSNMVLAPKPVQSPRIPVWIGGESRSAMARAAEVGDGWYPTINNPSRPMKTLEQLKGAIEEFRSVLRTSSRKEDEVTIGLGDVKPRWGEGVEGGSLFSGTPRKVRDDISKCEDLGVAYIGFNIRGKTADETALNLERFSGEVLEHS